MYELEQFLSALGWDLNEFSLEDAKTMAQSLDMILHSAERLVRKAKGAEVRS
jgi:hypothetical protein